MSILEIKVEPLATDLSFTRDSLRVILADGRERPLASSYGNTHKRLVPIVPRGEARP